VARPGELRSVLEAPVGGSVLIEVNFSAGAGRLNMGAVDPAFGVHGGDDSGGRDVAVQERRLITFTLDFGDLYPLLRHVFALRIGRRGSGIPVGVRRCREVQSREV